MSTTSFAGKKFLNDPDTIVHDALVGFGAAHGDLVRVDVDRRLVLRRGGPTRGKVGVLSGGGSGHEPLDAGFVGEGMLDAASLGEIFTSPVPDHIFAATKAIDGGAGVVYIVKNYTGDAMNFKLAAQLAEEAGIAVEIVFTRDDVAIGASDRTAGRRGTGVTPLVEKIAGARAAKSASLAEVADVARRVNAGGRSLGVALTSCVTPALGRPTFELGPDEIEFGVGIHGEPGRRREKLTSAAEMVDVMIDEILDDLRPADGSDLLAFVNGFGGTPLIELYVVYKELADGLASRGFRTTRNLVGNYVTSLDMAGMSITLLVLDEELTALWDAPVHTAGLRWGP
jgi:dihydroxyacetone kinase-like protein